MRLFLDQLGWELRKLCARRPTHIGFVAIPIFELVLLWMLQHGSARLLAQQAMERAGFTFAENFSGLTIANIMIGPTMTLLGSLFIALVAGEIVSKETEDGTLRMILCRPGSRRRALFVKLFTCLSYTWAVSAYVGATCLAVGLLFEGPGQLLVLPIKVPVSAVHAFWPGLALYGAASTLQALSMCTVATLAFMLSCFNVKPAAATVSALSAFIVDDTLRNLPFFAHAQDWFIMSRVVTWLYVYMSPLQLGMIVKNYTVLLALDAVFVAIGWLAFQNRDFKA